MFFLSAGDDVKLIHGYISVKYSGVNVNTPKQTNTESSSFNWEKMFKVCKLYFEHCNLFIIKN